LRFEPTTVHQTWAALSYKSRERVELEELKEVTRVKGFAKDKNSTKLYPELTPNPQPSAKDIFVAAVALSGVQQANPSAINSLYHKAKIFPRFNFATWCKNNHPAMVKETDEEEAKTDFDADDAKNYFNG